MKTAAEHGDSSGITQTAQCYVAPLPYTVSQLFADSQLTDCTFLIPEYRTAM